MKTITLIYGNDETSQAALKEIQHIQNKYSNIIVKNKINFILKTDLEYQNMDLEMNTYPTLFFIDDLEVVKIEGYDLNKLNNNYSDYFEEIILNIQPIAINEVFEDTRFENRLEYLKYFNQQES